MTSINNIRVDVPGAQAAYGPATAEVAGNRVVGGADGVRPGLSVTLAGMSSTYNANVDGTAKLTGQGSQFANGFDTADKGGATKAAAAGLKGPANPSTAAGVAPSVPGGDKFASRLTPSDLLKISRVSDADQAFRAVPEAAVNHPCRPGPNDDSTRPGPLLPLPPPGGDPALEDPRGHPTYPPLPPGIDGPPPPPQPLLPSRCPAEP